MRQGRLDALTVTATHIVSGKTTVFVDRAQGGVPPWTRDPRVVAKPVRMGPSHALASAAIPLLFPPIMIDGAYYSDGGVRQNTPLSPALRLGVDRVLVIGLRQQQGTAEAEATKKSYAQGEPYPSVVYLLGKLVDALMLDRVDYDISRLQGFNLLLADGEAAYGPSFYDQMSEHAKKVRGASYRQVDSVVIRPSRDLGEMALEFADTLRRDMGAVQSYLFSLLAAESAFGDADLLSYLLFDGRLASALIELGRADAHAARSDLLDFFRD